MLRELFLASVPGLTTPQQIGFQPPDQDWRAALITLNNLALNVYLIELRENRRLRSNERLREVELGVVTETPAARRLDCHYLISAWSGASPQMEPTVEEHRLLYNVAAALMRQDPLSALRIFGGALPPGFPPELAEADLPATIVPVDGFAKYAEFWGTMAGAVHPWKPAVYAILTVPVLLPREVAGPVVTTRIARYRQAAGALGEDVLVEIGGHVLDATVAPEVVVAGAWVRLEDPTGTPLQTTVTNGRGQFQFAALPPGNYRLQWRAGALPVQPPRAITVPSPTGEYDLRFV
jgi:Pvc16 N-terminal domain/Carboxypeptidase regulatory-like domain